MALQKGGNMTGKEGKPTRIDARAQGDKHHDTIETCQWDAWMGTFACGCLSSEDTYAMVLFEWTQSMCRRDREHPMLSGAQNANLQIEALTLLVARTPQSSSLAETLTCPLFRSDHPSRHLNRGNKTLNLKVEVSRRDEPRCLILGRVMEDSLFTPFALPERHTIQSLGIEPTDFEQIYWVSGWLSVYVTDPTRFRLDLARNT